MIPEYFVRSWASQAPWPRNELVEQDMIICRALIAIFSDPFLAEHLAFRGGTALHKLYLSPQPRYSEDIDLVQIHAAPSSRFWTTSVKLWPFWVNLKQKEPAITIPLSTGWNQRFSLSCLFG